jgi:hypothetical protein
MAEADQDAAGGDPQLCFASVYEFVREFLASAYARWNRESPEQKGGARWCEYWWRHPEASSRLDGLWRAYEQLRRDPGPGLSIWWRDHADPCMAQLMSPTGPFQHCIPAREGTSGQHVTLPSLPCADVNEKVVTLDEKLALGQNPAAASPG